MKNRSAATMMLLFVIGLTITGCSSRISDQGEARWITLLDGSNPKTLENWNRIGDANWQAKDGAIVADKGKGGHLVEELLQRLPDPGRVLGGLNHEQRYLYPHFRSENYRIQNCLRGKYL